MRVSANDCKHLVSRTLSLAGTLIGNHSFVSVCSMLQGIDKSRIYMHDEVGLLTDSRYQIHDPNIFYSAAG